MRMRTVFTCAAAMLAVIAVNVSAEAAGWRHGGWYGGYGYGGYGYVGYGYGGYAAVVPASADYGYFWGPPSRPGLYGGGF